MSPVAGKRITIANRAEIAIRIAATCRRMGAIPILLLGEPDLGGYAAREVGRVEPVGPTGSELDVERVIAAARRTGADFLHPGYGFLSERAELAAACGEAGIVFVGPLPETLRLCSDKLATREAAVRASVPVLAASPPLGDDPETWCVAAREVGYPLLVKPAGAGGGRGLRHVADESGLVEAVRASRREAEGAGGGVAVYLEHELAAPRHVEVQLAADGQRSIALGDRDCSIQRRHQKVIEEAPAPNLDDTTRAQLHDYARRVAEEVKLRGIATCEFLLAADGEIAFLEVNPRIQVEHPVTEQVTGIDLVEWQLLIATGERLPLDEAPTPRGHAIEARIYAEDPWASHFPAPGRLETVSWPARGVIRVDAGYESGDRVPADYDSMIAKVIALSPNRDSAIEALRGALVDAIISGVRTNIPWLVNLLDDPDVRGGTMTTQTAGHVTPQLPDHSLAPVATVAHVLERQTRNRHDAWVAIGPWRLTGRPSILIHGGDWEQRVPTDPTSRGWQGTFDEDGICTVVSSGTVERYAVREQGEAFEVTGNGGRWSVRLGPKPSEASAGHRAAGSGLVTAPLPATVLGIHVSEGDRVEAGQPLVTLFAMKMELVCAAPLAGTVESISVNVKDLVSADQNLATVRPEDERVEPTGEMS